MHGTVDFTAELQFGVLVHRKRVHVAAQQQRGALAVYQVDRQRRAADSLGDGDAVERLEARPHRGLSKREIETEFGSPMQLPPEVDHVVEDVGAADLTGHGGDGSLTTGVRVPCR